MQPENLNMADGSNAADGSNMAVAVQPEKPKNNRSPLFTIIILVTLAVFSVILNIVLALKGGKDDTSEVVAFNNPVVENADGTWVESYESERLYVDGTKSVSLALGGGEIVRCAVQGLVEVPAEDGKGMMEVGSETRCDIKGLSGNIYKIVEFGKGASPEEFNLGFVMTDGSVYYVKTVEAIARNDFTVKGPVNVGGYVVDVIKLDVLPTDGNPAGGLSSVFVMRDGSLIEFEDSMLE